MKMNPARREPPSAAELLRNIDYRSLPVVPEQEEKEPSLWELFLLGCSRVRPRFTPMEGEMFVRTPGGLRLERRPRR
jgi:hypothetical protein